MNRITKGKALSGGALQIATATIARTDTTAKNLFKIPGNAVIHELRINGAAASNAGTSATISVGKTGTNNHYLNAYDVKTAGTGAGQNLPNGATNLGNVGMAEIQVVGIYAESGTASSSGGPWTVTMLYSLP